MTNFFKLKERKTNLKTEIIAGIVTFFSMIYILFVNAGILSQAGMSYKSVFLATALITGFSTLLMGLWANMPIALAPGMGLNVFFALTVAKGLGIGWERALSIVLVSGILFLITSIAKIRKLIIEAIPKSIKHAIGVGIGGFITILGLKNAGIIVASKTTLVTIGDFTQPSVILVLFGIVLAFILYARKVKGAILISMLSMGIIGATLSSNNWAQDVMLPSFPNLTSQIKISSYFASLKEVFGVAFQNIWWVFKSPQAWMIVFVFLFVDMFDTLGTIIPITNKIEEVSKKVINKTKILVVDALGTIGGAILGTSTVTSYVESLSGIEEGGRTGLTSVVTGILFLFSIFLLPFMSLFNAKVTAIALILVGALMFGSIVKINWNKIEVQFSAFIIIITMILSFSIHWGIVLGFLVYPVVKVFKKTDNDVDVKIWILFTISLIFLLLKLIYK